MKKLSVLFLSLSFAFATFAASTLDLKVKGMHCGGCETKFKSAASDIKGIQEVNSVSASTGSAVITYDEKQISPEKAVEELASKSGFTVSLSADNGTVTSEGKPAGCCMKGQANPACKKDGKSKSSKK